MIHSNFLIWFARAVMADREIPFLPEGGKLLKSERSGPKQTFVSLEQMVNPFGIFLLRPSEDGERNRPRARFYKNGSRLQTKILKNSDQGTKWMHNWSTADTANKSKAWAETLVCINIPDTTFLIGNWPYNNRYYSDDMKQRRLSTVYNLPKSNSRVIMK